jgi:glycosyltransferase involved in cell wall biosynthesis
MIYELSAFFGLPKLSGCDILESHRIEHLLFRGGGRPINVFLHQNMAVLEQGSADIRWRLMPKLYRRLEKRVLYKASSVYCVREDAVNSYKGAYPSISNKFSFQSTWMDPDLFYPVALSERVGLRGRLSRQLMIPAGRKWMVAVGRLDHQKDPLMMIRALETVIQRHPDVHLIWVGEGVLRDQVLRESNARSLSGNVTLAGLLKPEEVGDVHRAADMFVMSSAYEGMPIALIEAMACGLPVVTTSVGEVRRLVTPGYNGEVCPAGDAVALAEAIIKGLDAIERYSGIPCTESANRYTPQKVLEPVYANYRQMAGRIKESGA